MQNLEYTIKNIAKIIHAQSFVAQFDIVITKLVIDSRAVIEPENSLFFAIPAKRNGHEFIKDAYQNGIRSFVISDKAYAEANEDANFLIVDDVLSALQQLATHNRTLYNIPVVAITGSNGKTIVKEWLYQLLAADFNLIRSPKSFNSQIGVPLSIWQISQEHTFGIFEAGISSVNEMELLANIIKPTIGILTNIGTAHAEGFSSEEEKLLEKLRLFKDCDLLIYSPDYTFEIKPSGLPGRKKFTWSKMNPADLQILFVEPIENRNYLRALYKGLEIECLIPFSDGASVENGIICWATLLALGYTPEEADVRLEKLTQVSMRLALKNGINQCSIIDDSYSADTSSLAIALDFLNQQNQHAKKTVILSDLFETGKNKEVLYEEIAALLLQKNISRLIGIGPDIQASARLFNLESTFYNSTEEFIGSFSLQQFNNETILVKGARRFQFEKISKLLTQKIHDTVLEINLNALTENLQFYKSKLRAHVKVMAMVKAFSYGSGSFEIANLLQYLKVDYLAVAYADEGIALRKAGITLPVMVMSPEPSAFEAIVKYRLEPELYSLQILTSFIDFISNSNDPYPVHLKIDTGMRRLGFEEADLPTLTDLLSSNKSIEVKSVFSHLAASEDVRHDDFTRVQITNFNNLSSRIQENLPYHFLKHISNTSAISRFPDAQFNMVRIGIGLYGFDAALHNNKGLQTVVTLKTTITQVKTVSPGQTVGYGRRGSLPEGGTIATVKIGYADGYRRSFGNGTGKMLINGKYALTIGAIAMDMCMIDVTGLNVKEGDEVIVFNDVLTIADLASQIDTIPYEILTNVSQRVKRVYYYE
jgi:alanine racemase